MRKLPASIALLVISALLSQAVAAPKGHRSAVNSVSAELCDEMVRHKTLVEGKPLSCRRLALVTFDYFGFDGEIHHDGEMVVLDAASEHVLDIFNALLERRFPLRKAKLLNLYDGDDDASMADNNTSSFNDRLVAGSNSLSLHAYGLAIDLNPEQNPFIQKNGATTEISPEKAKAYLDRTKARPGMAETVIEIFAENGFSIWGGDWHNPIDYQHFQVSRDLAGQLAQASREEAKAIFDKQLERYHQCRKGGGTRKACNGSPRT